MKKEKSSNEISLFKLVWPIFIELALVMLVGNADQFMISSYSEDAVAGVGNANQILNFFVIAFSVFSMSTIILVSQYKGAKNYEKVETIYTLSLVVNFIISLVISIIVLIFSEPIFHFMKVDSDVLPYALTYIRIVGGFIFLQAILTAFSAIFKSARLMMQTMLISIAINIFNVIGNLILINGYGPFPRLGVVGVSISTCVSRAIGIIFCIIIFVRNKELKMSFKNLKPFPTVELKKMLGIGIPSGAEVVSYNLSQIFILRMINSFGKFVVTTKYFTQLFAYFSYLYAMAVSQASQIIIGHYIGAKQIDDADKRIKKTLIMSVIVSLFMSVTLYLLSSHLFGIFTDNPEIINLGKKILFIEIFLEIGKCSNIALVRSLQAAGDVKFPTTVGIISMWVIAFGLSLVLGVFCNLGLIGVWIAMALDENIRAVIFVFRWRSGVWKTKNLIG